MKVIVLVLCSHDDPVYEQARSVWKRFMFSSPDVTVLFVYGKSGLHLTDRDAHDLVFPDVPEVDLLRKSVMALEVIDKRCQYEFLVRTNISTFWNLPLLAARVDALPLKGFAGWGPLWYHEEQQWFLSGIDLIVRPWMVTELVRAQASLRYDMAAEDVALNLFFHLRLDQPFIPRPPCQLENVPLDQVEAIVLASTSDHYRVKSHGDRLQKDAFIYALLLRHVYGFDVDRPLDPLLTGSLRSAITH